MRFWRRGARAGAVAALALACYAGAIPSGFAGDDEDAILDNPVVNGALPPAAALTHDHWGRRGAGTVGMWRPAITLWYRADHALFGGSPHAPHAVNVALHAAASAASYLALEALVGDPLALLSAALFAVLAAPSEAVEAIVGRADLLVLLCAALGLWAHSRASTLAAAALLALAAAAKESALLLPAAWLLCGPGERRTWRAGAAYALALLLVLTLRAALFGFPQVPADPMLNPQMFAAPGARVLGAARTFLRFVLPGIVDPFRRLYVCSAPACGPASASDPLAWAGVACALVLAAAPFLLWRRAPAAARGLLWFDIFYFPLSNLIIAVPAVYAERLLYAPCLGLCLAAAAGLIALRSRLVAVALGAALFIANAAAVQIQHLNWRSSGTLALSALQIAPDAAQVQHNAAVASLHDGDAAAAERFARQALRLHPARGETEAVLAVSLAAQGKAQEAEPLFASAAERLGYSPQIALDYAKFLAPRDPERARAVLQKARSLHPDDERLRSVVLPPP